MSEKTCFKLKSRKETAEILGVSEMTVYRLQRAGRISAIYLSSRCIRYRLSEIEALIQTEVVSK